MRSAPRMILAHRVQVVYFRRFRVCSILNQWLLDFLKKRLQTYSLCKYCFHILEYKFYLYSEIFSSQILWKYSYFISHPYLYLYISILITEKILGIQCKLNGLKYIKLFRLKRRNIRTYSELSGHSVLFVLAHTTLRTQPWLSACWIQAQGSRHSWLLISIYVF